jgi:hypothetical protein
MTPYYYTRTRTCRGAAPGREGGPPKTRRAHARGPSARSCASRAISEDARAHAYGDLIDDEERSSWMVDMEKIAQAARRLDRRAPDQATLGGAACRVSELAQKGMSRLGSSAQ